MIFSGLQTLHYEKQGRVAHIRLNRPAALNAMNLQMHTELCHVWDDFESDDDLWIAVLSGTGERAFSVGQDLKEAASRVQADLADRPTFGSRGRPGWPRLTERFSMAKPVIAKVRGFALGGGFELALACDIIIAAESAQFGLPEARLGLVPGAGGVFRLMRQIPSRTAMGLLMTGRRITAARAFDLGLINEVTPEAELDAITDQWVSEILECAPLSVRAIKEAGWTTASLPVEEAFRKRFVWEEARMHSEDAREGPIAFAEKRKPKWRGR